MVFRLSGPYRCGQSRFSREFIMVIFCALLLCFVAVLCRCAGVGVGPLCTIDDRTPCCRRKHRSGCDRFMAETKTAVARLDMFQNASNSGV